MRVNQRRIIFIKERYAHDDANAADSECARQRSPVTPPDKAGVLGPRRRLTLPHQPQETNVNGREQDEGGKLDRETSQEDVGSNLVDRESVCGDGDASASRLYEEGRDVGYNEDDHDLGRRDEQMLTRAKVSC